MNHKNILEYASLQRCVSVDIMISLWAG